MIASSFKRAEWITNVMYCSKHEKPAVVHG